MGTGHVGPVELEEELRRRLSGYRIVLELGLDQATISRARAAVKTMAEGQRSPGWIAANFPATFVTHLAGEANELYDGHLWNHIAIFKGRDSELRAAWHDAVQFLELEAFDLVVQDGAWKHLGPIVAHGGIPSYSARDFWRFLLKEMRRNPGAEGAELLQYWRLHESHFAGYDRSIRRFLLFGGATSVDFLDRCLRYASVGGDDQGNTLNLPEVLLRAYAETDASERRATRHRSYSLPPPRVLLDPWDRDGPVLELPVLPEEHRGGEWIAATSDREALLFKGSMSDRTSVPLGPARTWEVDFSSSAGRRSFVFSAFASGAVIFDPATRLRLDLARALAVPAAWLLVADGTEVWIKTAGTLEQIHHAHGDPIPTMTGAWSTYRTLSVDLTDARAIVLRQMENGEKVERVFDVVPPGARPTLSGRPLEGVRTTSGLDVYAHAPELELPNIDERLLRRWTLELRTLGRTDRHHLSELGKPGERIALWALLPDNYLGRVDIFATGPLGSDARTAFTLVEGLRVVRPDHLLLPGAVASVEIDAPSISINGLPSGTRALLNVPISVSEVQVSLKGLGQAIEIGVQVPRLMWAVATRTPGVLADRQFSLDVEEIRAGEVQALVVFTGMPDLQVILRLLIGGAQRQFEIGRTSRHGGRFRFPLTPFVTSLDQSAETRGELRLRIGQSDIQVGTIFARLEVHRLRIDPLFEADTVRLIFDEPKPLRNRFAFLWPLDRPWDPPITSRIADDVTGRAEFPRASIPQGQYRAQIVVDDGWSSFHFPRRAEAGAAEVAIGQWRAFGEPTAFLTTTMRTGRIADFSTEELVAHDEAALVCTKILLRDYQPPKPIPAALRAMTGILLTAVGVGSKVVTESAESPRSRWHRPLGNNEIGLLALMAPASLSRASIDEQTLRTLWRACPMLAARIDVPAARGGDLDARNRCAQFLGWDPDSELPCIASQFAKEAPLVGMSSEQIQELLPSVRPSRLLDFQTYLRALLELAIAAKQVVPSIVWSVERYKTLRQSGAVSRPLAKTYLRPRRPPTTLPTWTSVPAISLEAALHVREDDIDREESERILLSLFTAVPRLVEHDMALAEILSGAKDDTPIALNPVEKTRLAALETQRARVATAAAEAEQGRDEARKHRARAPGDLDGPPRILAQDRVRTALRQWVMDTQSGRLRRNPLLVPTAEEINEIAAALPRDIDTIRKMIRPRACELHGEELVDIVKDTLRDLGLS